MPSRVLKQVFAPHLNRLVKLGRRHGILGPHFRMGNYLRASLPAPPPSCDFRSAATKALLQLYLNDQLGDCVIAGGYHVVGVETGNANGGNPFVATAQQIIADYGAIGGYVPGDESTDQGCDEVTALNYWQSHGFANGTKLLGWLTVDATNETEVQQAMFLFENLFFGLDLPDAWISPFPSASGFTWDVGKPNPNNGHCIIGAGYNAAGVTVDTWGLTGTLTWAAVKALAVAKSGGLLSVMLTPDQLGKAQAKAPNGVAWGDLIADFDAMGGHVPVPAPPAPTPPAPTPTPPSPTPPPPAPAQPVTLAQAEAWAVSGLAALYPVMSRYQAEAAVKAALAKHWPRGG